MNGDKISNLFDAFSQLQEGQVTGTGLGLYGVRMRAEGLGGTCGARHNTASSTGSGTVIWFAIPYIPDRSNKSGSTSNYCIASASSDGGDAFNSGLVDISAAIQNANTRQSISLAEDAAMIRARHLTAIVVDDTLTVRKLMEKLLLRMGFESVDCYENGSKGLDAMMAGQVDIVFSDVQMPIMTGPEVCIVRLSSVYVLLLSATTNADANYSCC